MFSPLIPWSSQRLCYKFVRAGQIILIFFFSITAMDTPVPLAKAAVRRRSSRPPKSFLNFSYTLSVIKINKCQDMFTKFRLDSM